MLKYKVRLFLFFVMCLSVSSSVFALTWTELKAQVEAKYKDFFNEIKDMSLVMEVETNVMGKVVGDQGEKTDNQKGMEHMGPSEVMMFMKGEKYRIETKMSFPGGSGMPAVTDMKTILIFDGKDLWTVNPITGKQKLPAEANVSVRNQMNWWKDIPEKGKILGSEKVGIWDCYIVETQNEDSLKLKGWIEKKDLILTKIEYEGEDGHSYRVLNSDFKKVKKWEVPYTTEVFVGEEMMSKSNIKSLEVDKGLSDDLFDAEKIKAEGQINIQDMMKKFKMGGDD